MTLTARDGDVGLLNELLDDGVPVDGVDMFDDTALKAVARINRTDVIQVLLERGADLDKQTGVYRRTALHQAAEYNSTDVIEVLLKHGASTTIEDHHGNTPIDLARQENNKAAVSLLERH